MWSSEVCCSLSREEIGFESVCCSLKDFQAYLLIFSFSLYFYLYFLAVPSGSGLYVYFLEI
jgi:hypothetical protein